MFTCRPFRSRLGTGGPATVLTTNALRSSDSRMVQRRRCDAPLPKHGRSGTRVASSWFVGSAYVKAGKMERRRSGYGAPVVRECRIWAPMRSLSLCVTSGRSHMSIISEFASLCDIPFGGSVVTRCKTPGRRLASQYVSASSSYKMPHIDANAEFESLCDNPMLTWELVCGIRVAMRQRLGSQLFESIVQRVSPCSSMIAPSSWLTKLA